MWKTALAGVAALAITGSTLARAEVLQRSSHAAQSQDQNSALTHAKIAQFRALLKLRSDQEQYWPAVARVLHAMVRQTSGRAPAGLVQRLGARAHNLASDVASLRQLATVAKPLVRSMDDEQKFAALQFVNAMGYGAVVAQF
jgi:hypothetical protein